MKRGKFEAERVKKQRGKPVVLLVALALILGIAAGGTVAWLLDQTDPIVNTFAAGDVDITLTEATTTYKMVPGTTIAKNPTVTVTANSEACYVFVKLEKSANFDTFMTYTVAEDWIAGTGDSGDGVPVGVYFRTATASAAAQSFQILANNQVAVKSGVTKAQLNALTSTTQPTLTVTAYACQLAKSSSENFTAAEAWGQLTSST